MHGVVRSMVAVPCLMTAVSCYVASNSKQRHHSTAVCGRPCLTGILAGRIGGWAGHTLSGPSEWSARQLQVTGLRGVRAIMRPTNASKMSGRPPSLAAGGAVAQSQPISTQNTDSRWSLVSVSGTCHPRAAQASSQVPRIVILLVSFTYPNEWEPRGGTAQKGKKEEKKGAGIDLV